MLHYCYYELASIIDELLLVQPDKHSTLMPIGYGNEENRLQITHCYSPKLIDSHEVLYNLYSTSQKYHSPGKRATPLFKALTVFGDKKVINPTVAADSEMVNILTKLAHS
jgi:hypothetical protein